MGKKTTMKIRFLKRCMYGGKERKPEDTKKDALEVPVQDGRFLVSCELAVAAE